MIDISKGEQNTPEHLARSPLGTLPVLELDNGKCIFESHTIMCFLEEIYPAPQMIGADPESRAMTLQIERYIEMNILLRIIRTVHATNSPLGLPANPAIAMAESGRLSAPLTYINELIGTNEFVLGGHPTIADCTLFAALYFAEFGEMDLRQYVTSAKEGASQRPTPELHNLYRWYLHFKQRPSTRP